MKAGRTSIGSRIISMLLVICMVLGMAPLNIFAVKAAAAELTNLERIQAYAKNLFDANFDNSLDYSGKFTWCTENAKGHKWTYFDGLMVDAYLAMGMAGDKGNILEFASNYYNTQLTEAGVIRRFGTNETLDKEVDSVPPALGLFDLLGTVADQDRYHTVLHDMYKALQSYDTLPNVGGNFRHKESTSWTTYPFALDGIYMALPFLVEYANAVESGKLENTNKIVPSDVRTDVYNRLVWVADHMQDETTKLYFHGVQENGTTTNGQFWTRGIGWYAVALVDIIGMMPEGGQKTTLESKLIPLFDGMLSYQDTATSLWYNVTNYTAENLSGNKLETSGTACMAYALMKAYNNGWVGEAYGRAGLNAFNGIVTEKLSADNTTIKDVYKSSGVSTEASYYATNSTYESNEAKGVGAVLLAAAQVEKTQQKLGLSAILMGTAEPTGGMVKAPAGLTVAVGGTPNYSDVKASVVYNDGTIKNVSGSNLTYTMGDAASGKATVTATYEGVAVGTFEVNVVDPTTPVTANGVVTVNPASGAPTGTSYVLDTDGIDNGGTYIIVGESGGKYYAFSNYEGGHGSNGVGLVAEVTYDAATNTVTFVTASNATASEWQFTEKASADADGYANYTASNGEMFIRTSDNAKPLAGSEGTFYVKHMGNGSYRATKKTGDTTTKNRELLCDGKQWTMSAELSTVTNTIMFFKKVEGAQPTVHDVQLSVAPNTVNMTLNGTSALTTNVTVDGNAATNPVIDWTSSNTGIVTVNNGTLTAFAAGTATVKATLTAVTVDGVSKDLDAPITVSVTVNVTDGSTPTTEPTTETTVPEEPKMEITANGSTGNTGTVAKNGTLQLSVTGVTGGSIAWSSNKMDVATVDSTGLVTGHKAGTATITATWTPATRAAAGTQTATFEVTVADTGENGNVTITTPATSGGDLTAPTFTSDGFVEVKAAVDPTGETVYQKITTLAEITSGGKFVIVNAADSTVAMRNTLASNSSGRGGTANGSIANDVWSFTDATQAAASLWTFTGSNNSFAIASNEGHHLRNNGDVISSRTGLANSAIEVTATGFKINLENSGRYLKLNGTEWTRSSSETDASEILLFKETTSGGSGEGTPAVYGKLESSNGKGFAYTVNTTTVVQVEAAIKSGFKVYVNSTNSDTGATEVTDWAASGITIDTSSLKMDTVGEYSVLVKMSNGTEDVTIGTIPVNVVAAATAAETHEFTVTMPTVAGVSVEANSTLTPTVGAPTAVVAGTSTAATVNSYTVTWSSADSSIATVDAATGVVTGVKAGTTNVTGKLTAIKINDLTGETVIADALTVTVPVTVTGTSTPDPVGPATYVLDIDGIDVGEEYLIVAKTADGKYYALKNVTAEVGGSTNAEALLVTVNGETITIGNESDAKLSEWYFSGTSGAVDITNINNTNTNPVYVHLGNNKILNKSSQAYLTVVDQAAGSYHLAKSSSGSKMVFNGTTFTRGDTAQDLYLYKKREITTAVSVNPSSISMNLFDTATLVPTVLYQGAITNNYVLTWTSSNPDAVAVDSAGKLEAKASGNANITVRLTEANGAAVTDEIIATVPVTVGELKMTISQETLGLFLDPNVEGLLHHSTLTEKTLTTNVTSGGTAWEGAATIVWSSNNTAVATVDTATGLVKAVATGNATVTAKLTHFNGKELATPLTATCEVTVGLNGVKDIILTPKTVTVGWKNNNETDAEKQEQVKNALEAIVATIIYQDGSSFNKTLKDLEPYPNVSVSMETAGVNTAVTQPTQYTVDIHIVGPVNSAGYHRNAYVRVIDPAKLNADGIVAKETSAPQYRPAASIEDGKEYIIVAFPTAGDMTNGVVLSNGNATNNASAKPLAVEVTVTPDGDFVTIVRKDGATTSDALWKWTFSQQTAGNWFVYNFQHRVSLKDKSNLLQARFGISTDENRLYATPVDSAVPGQFYLTQNAYSADAKNRHVSLDSGSWKGVETSSPTETAQKLYLYERVVSTENVPVNLEVSPQSQINLHAGMTGQAYASVFVDGVQADQWNITWSSADESIATVDPNTGKITPASPVKAGEVQIIATLHTANGMDVIPNEGSAVTKSVTVSVSDAPLTYSVVNGAVTTRLGGRPNYSGVQVKRHCDDHGDAYLNLDNPDVELDPLSATPIALNLTQPGVYKVPVYHLQKQIGDVEVTVSPDPYFGLSQTTAYPEYPDVGGIRIRKFGTGGKKYLETGLANVELQVAGVSGKSNVDVVLVVDVSNSMAWSMDWFLTNPSAKNDADKIPAEGGTDKLDLAMSYAQSFADTLLGNGSSGNTLSFVTFAGNDLDHRSDGGDATSYADSVKTVFTSVSNAADAKASFAGTKFTKKVVQTGGKVECYLTIAGTDGNGLDNADSSKRNRGNTNYDYAFGQAMDAVAQIKTNYANANGGQSYEDSGRQIHVVFMTDGAPSHYNGIWNKDTKAANIYATLWGDPNNNRYTAKPYSDGDWLTYIGWYNTLATQLYSQITEMHVVGFDLDHGGYDGKSWGAANLNKVLQGLVQNRVLDSVQADDAATLEKFFSDLAANLTYSATNAIVTDIVGNDFDLFTGIQGNATTQAEPATISVRSYDLWKAADVGNGCTETQVGERKDAEGKELETVTFETSTGADGKVTITKVTSSEIGEIPVTYDVSGNPEKVEAKYFTYELATKKFTWKIGNVEDKEYTLTYWAYLKLSKDGVENPTPEVLHDTNKEAILEYVDMNGRRAHRVFPVPQLPWDQANIGVRFFLVNSEGQYVNRAGHPFTDKANRVFLSTRQYYNYKLGDPRTIKAQEAFEAVKSKLGAATYSLYSPAQNGEIKVIHTADGSEGGSATITADANSLITAFDLVTNSETKGNFLHTIVDIPVVLEDYGTAETPLNADTVVMDFGLPMPINVLTNDADRTTVKQVVTTEADGTTKTEEKTVAVNMSVMGFVPYAEGTNLSNYIGEYSVKTTLTGEYGTFSKAPDGEVRYTPGKILTGMEKVFVAVKLEPSEGQAGTEDFRILLNPLTIVPATVVCYETDDNMAPAFTYNGTWHSAGTQSADIQDHYKPGEDVYGFDSSYIDDGKNSNISAMWVEGTGANNTKVSFTFTGTGFDIISRTGPEHGTIRMQVKDSSGAVVKKIVLINKGDTDLYQVPVISVDGLTRDTYTVEIGVLQKQLIPGVLDIGNVFYFDAVWIYGTMTGNEIISSTTAEDGSTSSTTVNDIYTADGEANTVFGEIRDSLITSGSFGKDGVMFFEGMGENVTAADYAAKGPNNEVYLGNGNAIAFSFDIQNTNSALDLGMKSADGNQVTANVTIVQNGQKYPETPAQITTSCGTALFYDLLKQTGFNGTGIVQVVISNTGAGVLSLTDLKYNKTTGSAFVYSSETLNAAQFVNDDQVDVQDVVVPDQPVHRAEEVKLTVTTGTNVEKLLITNHLGGEVWSSAEYTEVEGTLVWTVTLRPTLLGKQTFTVYGLYKETEASTSYSYRNGVQTGEIEVKLY